MQTLCMQHIPPCYTLERKRLHDGLTTKDLLGGGIRAAKRAPRETTASLGTEACGGGGEWKQTRNTSLDETAAA